MRKIFITCLFILPMIVSAQLPGSGAISIGDLRTEAGASGAYSLQGNGASDYSVPGSPTTLAEFYGLSYGGPTCVQVDITTLKYHASNSNCNPHAPTTAWGDNAGLGGCTALYTSSACTTVAPTGWYSNGTIRRYWNGTTLGSSELC